MSISQRLYLILGIMILLISAELTALWFTVNTLSAVRAYVGGEGLWSKAQKDATYQLEVYGRTHDARNYQNYRTFLSIPLGDRQTRLEMAKADPDYSKEVQGFALGRNHPDDIPGMIDLFRRFRHVSYISQALADWTQADSLILRVDALGTRLHHEVQTAQPEPVVDRTLNEISLINQTLTQVEDHFSYTLGQGSRWLTTLVLTILVSAAVTVELTGLYLTTSITRGISRRLNAMLKVTDRISKGDYRTSLDTTSTDEIGRLSLALNSMTGDIGREQARAENAVRATDAALREAQRVAHIGSWEWDIETDVVLCSLELFRLWEMKPVNAGLRYADFIKLVHPDDRSDVEATIQAVRSSRNSFSFDYRVQLPSGLERWFCSQGRCARDTSGVATRLMGTTLDITDRKLVEEKMAHLAQHDPLTDLPNRPLLIDRLRQAIAQTQRNKSHGALLFMDLDHFKDLNDTRGHGAGDLMLVLVAERLKGVIRGIDTVSRSGGDEFLIVLTELATPDSASVVARKILAAFQQPFPVSGSELQLTASIGISVFPDDGTDVESLIRFADTAMYQAKRLGRNKIQTYDSGMDYQSA